MPHAKIWLVTLLMATVILYGSLYPFQFRVPPHGIGPLATFIASIWQRPGRGDALANILLYIPLGFFFVLGFRRGPPQNVGLVLATAIGALLSLSIELTQYYDEGRVTSFSDFYTNTFGALLGALAARGLGARFQLPLIGVVAARPIPTLLLAAWLAYRMYPYVPTIDLHKYWDALKPIVLTPSLTGYDLFRQTAVWLAVYALIEACVRRRQSAFLALSFAVAVLGAKVLIITDDRSCPIRWERASPTPFGCCCCCSLHAWRQRLPGLSCAATSSLCGFSRSPFCGRARLRLDTVPEPDAGIGGGRHAGVPREFFLYGTMVYLLGDAVGSRLAAALFAATVLFATSWAEIYLPGRQPRSPTG